MTAFFKWNYLIILTYIKHNNFTAIIQNLTKEHVQENKCIINFIANQKLTKVSNYILNYGLTCFYLDRPYIWTLIYIIVVYER